MGHAGCRVPAKPETPSKGATVAASLKLVPADVSFYHAMLRNREQVEIVAGSRAWAKFKTLPVVQDAWSQIEAQWTDGNLAGARQLLSLPENEQLLDLVKEMFSDEVFIYGDPQFAVTLDSDQRSLQHGGLCRHGQGNQKGPQPAWGR